eukprot:scaffold660347_cov39-Prasinocladus_malaysianus.AAC.2
MRCSRGPPRRPPWWGPTRCPAGPPARGRPRPEGSVGPGRPRGWPPGPPGRRRRPCGGPASPLARPAQGGPGCRRRRPGPWRTRGTETKFGACGPPPAAGQMGAPQTKNQSAPVMIHITSGWKVGRDSSKPAN